MTGELKNVIAAAAQEQGLTCIAELSAESLTSKPKEGFCICGIKSAEYSPRITAVNGASWGTEAVYSISARLLGKRCGYSDYEQTEQRADGFMQSLGTNGGILLLELERSPVQRNSILGRLEISIAARVKMLIMNESDTQTESEA
ncbi:hypothetical protein [Ruminococcus sp. Marseille-P6503]|uniref:hypothetical protein n=1 Tax=Ruminococcus sp. Marseille-P6503 TaxID=2364796 RepID=UPI000F526DAA|nr:hypothetical protein [Ruminococcus sp. Marseille-P6503]